MPKKSSTKTVVKVPRSGELRTACMKIRGLVYLVERIGNDPCPPFNLDEVFFGVSLVFGDLHDEIRSFALLSGMRFTERSASSQNPASPPTPSSKSRKQSS